MGKRNLAAVLILIVGAVASFYCYARLQQLVPMSVPDMVTQTQATITHVHTPMIPKGSTTSDVDSDVQFTFHAAGKQYNGAYSVQGGDKAPVAGAPVPVVYFTSRPDIFLQKAEYEDLPRQLRALRIMMVMFALTAIIAPFGVMKHG